MAFPINIDKQPTVLKEQLRYRNHFKRKSACVESPVINITLHEELSDPGEFNSSYRQHLQIE